MACLPLHDLLHRLQADWTFSESYHGKGAHDGIGAIIKFLIRQLILMRALILLNAYEVYELALTFAVNIVVLYSSIKFRSGLDETKV